jgi:hypothetical protein
VKERGTKSIERSTPSQPYRSTRLQRVKRERLTPLTEWPVIEGGTEVETKASAKKWAVGARGSERPLHLCGPGVFRRVDVEELT